jgi:hypothetical protein
MGFLIKKSLHNVLYVYSMLYIRFIIAKKLEQHTHLLNAREYIEYTTLLNLILIQ